MRIKLVLIANLLVDVELDMLHGIDGQVVVAEERVQTKQTDQAKVAEHLVQAALGEQIVLELLEELLLMLTELGLVDAAVRVRDRQRESGVLEHLQLLVYVRLGHQGVEHIQHTVDVPDLSFFWNFVCVK